MTIQREIIGAPREVKGFHWVYAACFCVLLNTLVNAAIASDGKHNIKNDINKQPMNVLFIAIDDLRPELGCYGKSHINSPNVDALAKQGLQFNRAYCQFALCNPSRASLLTGRYPDSIKIYNLETFLRTNSPNVVTLPQFFKQSGYEARSIGKIFHVTNGNHEDDISWSKRAWQR